MIDAEVEQLTQELMKQIEEIRDANGLVPNSDAMVITFLKHVDEVALRTISNYFKTKIIGIKSYLRHKKDTCTCTSRNSSRKELIATTLKHSKHTAIKSLEI